MTVHILELPVEVLLQIFSFLPAGVVLRDLLLVCRRFREVLGSEWYWRGRYAQHLMGALPIPSLAGIKAWQRGCLEGEFAREACDGGLEVTELTGATVGLDCVHIMHPELHGSSAVIAAGSRDSSVYVWRKRVGGGEGGGRSMRSFTGTCLLGHRGWVWSLTSDPRCPQLLCSGAWDATVQVWDVAVAKNIASITGQHKSAVLCLDMPQPNVLISGSYDKHVRQFDLRQPISLVSASKEHSKPVLCLAATERHVYSGSEDRSVCVWDRRTQHLLQKIKLKSIVTSLHLDQESRTLSTAGGTAVNLYDCSLGTLQQQMSFTAEHSQTLTSVFHNLGMVVTASKDGSVKLHSPGNPSHCLSTLDHHSSAVTKMDFSKNMLALASGDRTVSLWTPKIPA